MSLLLWLQGVSQGQAMGGASHKDMGKLAGGGQEGGASSSPRAGTQQANDQGIMGSGPYGRATVGLLFMVNEMQHPEIVFWLLSCESYILAWSGVGWIKGESGFVE